MKFQLTLGVLPFFHSGQPSFSTAYPVETSKLIDDDATYVFDLLRDSQNC